MKLLVLTPTRGTSRFLHETVASVEGLQAEKRHVLVCPAAVQGELAGKFPRLEMVTDEGAGPYAALSRGLVAGGDWDAFTWINDDDTLVAEGVDKAWAGLLRNDGADVFYGRVSYMDVNGRNLGPLPVCRHPQRLPALFAAALPALTQQGTLVRRRLAEQLGGFDPRYALAGDFDYWARALKLAAMFCHVPELVARYRLHRGQLSSDLGRLDREIGESSRMHFTAAPFIQRATRIKFRFAHLPDLARRFARAGCWRTSSLYRRAMTTHMETERSHGGT
jgi:hypothetical protein